jgi:hypothetical protein
MLSAKQQESQMGIRCMVFTDRSMTGEPFEFAAVPQIGDSIQIHKFGEPLTLTVEGVLHVAKGVFEGMKDGDVQINVSSRLRHADGT